MAIRQKNNFLVFDFETGGLVCNDNPALEIAVVALDAVTLEEVDSYQSYILPYKSLEGNDMIIQPKALEYNGISMSTVLDKGKPVEKVVDDICKMAERLNKGTPKFSKPILAGHNVDFDIPFLSYIFVKANKELKKYVMGKDDMYGNFVPLFFDTWKMSEQRWREDESLVDMKLGTICEKIGIPLEDAHSALPDTQATAGVLRYLLKCMRYSGGTVSSDTVVEVTEKSRKKFQF